MVKHTVLPLVAGGKTEKKRRMKVAGINVFSPERRNRGLPTKPASQKTARQPVACRCLLRQTIPKVRIAVLDPPGGISS